MADADVQIKRGGGGSSRPRDKGEPGLETFFSRPFGPQFGLKNKREGGGGSRAPLLDPALQRASAFPAIRGISRQEKTRRKKKDLCRPPTRSFI